MSDAIAAVKIPASEVRSRLENVRGQDGSPIRVRGLDDATLVFTGAPMRETEPDELAWIVRQLLGDLLDRHGDERGVLVFPEIVKTKAKTWTDLVDEIGELGEWVPVVDASYVPERIQNAPSGSLEAAMGQVMAALGPDLGQMQQSLAGGDPEAMQAAAQRMQALLASPEGQPLMEMLQKMDVGALMEQAERAGLSMPDVAGLESPDDDDDEPAKR